MAAGTCVLTLLSLLVGQAPDEVFYTNQRELRIPITFDSALRNELRDLLLFASWDKGQTYQQVAAVKPDKNEFVFNAPNDATYWLKAAVINRQGKQEPENIQQGLPDRKIVIDTIKPIVRAFTAQRQGDEIVLAWDILEDHFDPAGIRLEYQARDNLSSFPTAIPAQAGISGQTRFRPTTASPLSVRLTVKDKAGNQASASAEVSGTVNVAAYNPSATSTDSVIPAIPPPAPPPVVGSSETNLPAPPVFPEPMKQVQPPPPNNWAPAPGTANDPKEKVIATSDAPPPAPAPLAAAPESSNVLASTASRKAPPITYVNHPEVLLEYELTRVGKSHIGSVDLYVSQNDGQTWQPYAYDKELKDYTQRGPYQATVTVPGDGVYGFILVVKSKAGLGKAPPRDGDVPEIRVEVDTKPPQTELKELKPDPQRPGCLLMKWSARDKNLAPNPITLEWSENKTEWKVIAGSLPNTGAVAPSEYTGQYSWQLPDYLPVQVYLRLRVKDLAGNESTAVTRDPQLVDLTEPEVRLIGASKAPRVP